MGRPHQAHHFFTPLTPERHFDRFLSLSPRSPRCADLRAPSTSVSAGDAAVPRRGVFVPRDLAGVRAADRAGRRAPGGLGGQRGGVDVWEGHLFGGERALEKCLGVMGLLGLLGLKGVEWSWYAVGGLDDCEAARGRGNR